MSAIGLHLMLSPYSKGLDKGFLPNDREVASHRRVEGGWSPGPGGHSDGQIPVFVVDRVL